MKTQLFTLILTLLLLVSFSNETYQMAMAKSIEKLFQAKSITEYVDLANQFERISKNEKTEWLPLYYASFAYVMISFQETENAKKDVYLDQAQKFLDQAFQIEPNESELHLMQAFIYPSRINIDPMGRGAIYIGALNKSLDTAIELNPDNPRPYYLRATMILYTPEAYGGGAARSLPMFRTAKEKFDNFKPQTAIFPNWGNEMNEAEMEKLNKIVKQ